MSPPGRGDRGRRAASGPRSAPSAYKGRQRDSPRLIGPWCTVRRARSAARAHIGCFHGDLPASCRLLGRGVGQAVAGCCRRMPLRSTRWGQEADCGGRSTAPTGFRRPVDGYIDSPAARSSALGARAAVRRRPFHDHSRDRRDTYPAGRAGMCGPQSFRPAAAVLGGCRCASERQHCSGTVNRLSISW